MRYPLKLSCFENGSNLEKKFKTDDEEREADASILPKGNLAEDDDNF